MRDLDDLAGDSDAHGPFDVLDFADRPQPAAGDLNVQDLADRPPVVLNVDREA